MYTDKNKKIIEKNAPYTNSKGIKYPRSFPKDEIPELFKVTETSIPVDDNIVVEGFYIDETYTQVWNTRDKTQEEIDEEAKNITLNQLTSSDRQMARVTEDLIDTLVTKGVITLTDLPQDVQTKLSDRKTYRQALVK